MEQCVSCVVLFVCVFLAPPGRSGQTGLRRTQCPPYTGLSGSLTIGQSRWNRAMPVLWVRTQLFCELLFVTENDVLRKGWQVLFRSLYIVMENVKISAIDNDM